MNTKSNGQVTKEELKALVSILGESVDDEVIDEMIQITD
jgi:hypothetical protein